MGLLEILIVILLIMWLGGMVLGPPVAVGSLFHLLLVIVLVIVIVRVIQGRPPV